MNSPKNIDVLCFGGEDWCYRIKKAGWKILFIPCAEIIHLGGQSTQKIRGDMVVQIRLSILKFISKHCGGLSHKIACFLMVFFFAVRVPIWLLASLFGRKHNREQGVIKLWAYLSGIRQILFTFTDKSVAKGSA